MTPIWPLGLPSHISEQTTLSRARQRTLALLEALQNRLDPLVSDAPEILTAAVSGSLGRLEALSHSDCDLLVVTEAAPHSGSATGDRAPVDKAWSLIEPLGFPHPESGGIFSTAVSMDLLRSPEALGSLSEPKSVFGKRMQLLLDCRPVYRPEGFSALLRAILEWYATGYLEHDPEKQWTYLLNDLNRYLHSYSGWKQFDFGDGEEESWCTLQLKLRTSRLLAFAGLLLLLGESSNNENDKISWLHERLYLSPLERIALVFEAHEDRGLERIVDTYETFMAAIDDEATRFHLLAAGPKSIADLGQPRDPVYARLHRQTGVIAEELARFLLDRRNDWQARFFQYYLF